jgi:hypothetical protein
LLTLRAIEHAVLMHLVDSIPDGLSRADLGSTLDDIDPAAIDAALAVLSMAGVAEVDGDTIVPWACVRYVQERHEVIAI